MGGEKEGRGDYKGKEGMGRKEGGRNEGGVGKREEVRGRG